MSRKIQSVKFSVKCPGNVQEMSRKIQSVKFSVKCTGNFRETDISAGVLNTMNTSGYHLRILQAIHIYFITVQYISNIQYSTSLVMQYVLVCISIYCRLCIILYCIVLYCILLNSVVFVLYCFVLYFIVLICIVLFFLYCNVL